MNPKKIFHSFKKEKINNDPGFGTQITEHGGRFINKNGTFNVKRTGLSFFQSFSLYHWLLSLHWISFVLAIFITYLIINLSFASLYYFIGTQHLGGLMGETIFEQISESFFFSTQTFTTVGYGRINPIGLATNIIASLESLFGLLFFALISGLLYGRFSKPNAKILFSKNAVIAPYYDITGFEFRIANSRSNQLVDVHVEVALSLIEKGKRKYYELALERTRIDFFPLSWTIVHPIDENSPLNGIGYEELEKSDAEFLILIKAFDDTFSQNVHTRTSYKYNEVIYGVKFAPIFFRKDGITKLELDRLNETVEVVMED